MADTFSALLSASFASTRSIPDNTGKDVKTLSIKPTDVQPVGDAIGAGKYNIHWSQEATLGNGASATLDLRGLAVDAMGNMLNFAKIKGLVIWNKEAGGGASVLKVGAAAAQPWEGAAAFLDTGGKIRVIAGAFLMLACSIDDANGYTVGAAVNNLKVLNENGAASLKYQIGFLGEHV